MSVTRREAMLSGLLGAGYVGLRAMVTGLPVSLLLRPRRALADYGAACFDKGKAQYLILATSASGDPMNANMPGMYDNPDIVHPQDAEMAPVPIRIGGKSVRGARPWSTLPQAVLDRSCFFHHATLTNAHQNQPKVMRLMGAVRRQEMLVSLLAKHLHPCLDTVQAEPAVVGASGPSEALSYQGRTLPIVSPTALRDLLVSPKGVLAEVQKVRDQDLDRISAILKESGNNAQREFMDRFAISQKQARSISQDLLQSLAEIKDNGPAGQIAAATALIQMNVAPVVSIRLPFGGDNHSDADLARESAQTVSSVAAIGSLLTELSSVGLSDRVTFMALNVFGRTLTNKHRPAETRMMGRDHYASHHCALIIGKNVRGSVVGGVGLRPKATDVGAMPFDSKTGQVSLEGDVPFEDTLGALGKTVGAAVGLDPAVLAEDITAGKAVAAALA